MINELDKNVYSKPGIMLGLGEKEDEVMDIFSGSADANCDSLSIGQYLVLSPYHYPVGEFLKTRKVRLL